MAAAPATELPDGEAETDGASRRCIVTGEIRPKAELLRFVVDPEGRLTPDITGRLPGRGLWLLAHRDIVTMAVTKRLFARAARGAVIVEEGLADRIEALLVRRCGEILGLARRAGQAVAGFVKVESALRGGTVAVLVAASDGAADGRAKLAALAPGMPVVSPLTSEELGAAFGREHAVHAALNDGRLAGLFLSEAARLGGFRGVPEVGKPMRSDAAVTASQRK